MRALRPMTDADRDERLTLLAATGRLPRSAAEIVEAEGFGRIDTRRITAEDVIAMSERPAMPVRIKTKPSAWARIKAAIAGWWRAHVIDDAPDDY